MDTFDDFFAGQTFKKKIATFCARSEWTIEALDEKDGLISRIAPSGRRKFCFLTRMDKNLVEIFVPALVQVEKGEGFRGDLANLLLRKNRMRAFGFWCIVSINEETESLALMHNAFLNSLNQEEFDFITSKFVEECDSLDTALENFVRTWSKNA